MISTSTKAENTVVCAPRIIRENISLPYRSVPKICCADGFASAFARSCSYGSYGVRCTANAAVKSKIPTRISSMINFIFVFFVRMLSSPAFSRFFLQPDTRIQIMVNDIRHQIYHNINDCHPDHIHLYHRIIPGKNRIHCHFSNAIPHKN